MMNRIVKKLMLVTALAITMAPINGAAVTDSVHSGYAHTLITQGKQLAAQCKQYAQPYIAHSQQWLSAQPAVITTWWNRQSSTKKWIYGAIGVMTAIGFGQEAYGRHQRRRPLDPSSSVTVPPTTQPSDARASQPTVPPAIQRQPSPTIEQPGRPNINLSLAAKAEFASAAYAQKALYSRAPMVVVPSGQTLSVYMLSQLSPTAADNDKECIDKFLHATPPAAAPTTVVPLPVATVVLHPLPPQQIPVPTPTPAFAGANPTVPMLPAAADPAAHLRIRVGDLLAGSGDSNAKSDDAVTKQDAQAKLFRLESLDVTVPSVQTGSSLVQNLFSVTSDDIVKFRSTLGNKQSAQSILLYIISLMGDHTSAAITDIHVWDAQKKEYCYLLYDLLSGVAISKEVLSGKGSYNKQCVWQPEMIKKLFIQLPDGRQIMIEQDTRTRQLLITIVDAPKTQQIKILQANLQTGCAPLMLNAQMAVSSSSSSSSSPATSS